MHVGMCASAGEYASLCLKFISMLDGVPLNGNVKYSEFMT